MLDSIIFSIIVPVFNNDKYLEICLNSILNQTYTNFEIICINDGSNDKSGEICDRFSVKDSRVKVIHQENKGVSSVRNLGVSISKGNYICFVDSDDYIDSNLLEDLNNVIKEKKSDIIMFGWNSVFGGEKKEHKLQCINIDKIKEKILLDDWPSYACNKCFKKSFIKKYKFPTGQTHEDLFLIPTMVMATDKINILTKSYYFYNKNNLHSITKIIDSRKNYYFWKARLRNYNLSEGYDNKIRCRLLKMTISEAIHTYKKNISEGLLSNQEVEDLMSFFNYVLNEKNYVSIRDLIRVYFILNFNKVYIHLVG